MTGDTQSDAYVPFHEYCRYCTTRCTAPPSTSSQYVLVTNVWNEEPRIERAFEWMMHQSRKPLVWLWIDDGSTDGTYEEIKHLSEEHPELKVWVERMPMKEQGNLNTIGNAYTEHMPGFIKRLRGQSVDYYAIQDVGTQPCPNYYARIMHLMDEHPEIGASSGYVIGEERARESGMPMGDCKVTRWEIIREIEEYWPLSPDTFVNIKTLKRGCRLKIWAIPVFQDEPSFGTTARGMFYQGQLNYFVGRPFLGVLLRALRRLFLRRHGTDMLRGYLYEREKQTWRCEDPDVLEFYGHGQSPLWVIWNLLKTRGRYSD